MARAALRKRSRHLNDYLLVMREHDLLGEEDARAYLNQACLGSQAARRALIEACLPLVVHWASRFRGGVLTFSSLLEAGNLALLQAIAEAERQPVEGTLLGFLQARVELSLQSALAAQGN